MQSENPLQTPISEGQKQRLIMDFGAYGGEDAQFYLAKGFSVISIEANIEFARKAIARNQEAFEAGRYHVLNAAIAEQSGEVDFFVHQHGDWSSVEKNSRFTAGQFKAVRVAAVTADEVFKEFGVPYYVKIDIEGMDHAVIDAICRLREKPRFVSFEISPKASGCGEQLQQAGYARFKLVAQHEVPRMKPPNPAREGVTIDFTFESGTSGPFGEETPGPWLRLAGLRDAIENLDWHKGHAVWWDIHAALA
jgi:FkbM family methyltransferase